jgi:hypothetical protein
MKVELSAARQRHIEGRDMSVTSKRDSVTNQRDKSSGGRLVAGRGEGVPGDSITDDETLPPALRGGALEAF